MLPEKVSCSIHLISPAEGIMGEGLWGTRLLGGKCNVLWEQVGSLWGGAVEGIRRKVDGLQEEVEEEEKVEGGIVYRRGWRGTGCGWRI